MILVIGGADVIGSEFVLQWLTAQDEPVFNLDKVRYVPYASNLPNLANAKRTRSVTSGEY